MGELVDPADVDALRSEVARLQERNASLEQARSGSASQSAARIGRAVSAVILIALGTLCLIVSPAAIWGRNLLLDTDRYVDTLAPLAEDPGVQRAVVNAVAKQVSANVDVSSLAEQVLPPRAVSLLGPPLQSALDSLVRTVTTAFVESPAFGKLWVGVNRIAHEQVTYALTGDVPKNAATEVDDSGKVTLNLAPVVDKVKSRLVDAGLTVAKNLPTVGATIEIADIHGLQSARSASKFLNKLADWLPWVGLVFLAGGIALSRKRRRALIVSTLCVGAGMVVVGIGLAIGERVYLDQVPTSILPRATADFIFDTVVRYLRWGIRLVLLLMLIVAFGAWVSGPSGPAIALRHGVVRAPRALGTRLDAGPVGPFVVRYSTALRIAAVALMVLILSLIDRPSLGVVVVLAVILVILLLVIEVLRATAVRERNHVGEAGG